MYSINCHLDYLRHNLQYIVSYEHPAPGINPDTKQDTNPSTKRVIIALCKLPKRRDKKSKRVKCSWGNPPTFQPCRQKCDNQILYIYTYIYIGTYRGVPRFHILQGFNNSHQDFYKRIPELKSGSNKCCPFETTNNHQSFDLTYVSIIQ